MFQFDLLKLIPQSLKRKAIDTTVDFVADQAKKFLGDEIATKIRNLRSDAAFYDAFEKGLQQAGKRFAEEYEEKDEDLVAVIAADKTFFENETVQDALLAILKQPSAYLSDERRTLHQSFEGVLPLRKNRERVDQAVTYLLKCLAEELWHLPELQPVYSLQFQRITAEATHEQVALQKAQLYALTSLNEGIRDSLLQLTDAIVEQKLLSRGDAQDTYPQKKIYHNLPRPDYDYFIGRKKELEKVRHFLLPETRPYVLTINGIGGVGKSALALEVAHTFMWDYDQIPEKERFEAIIWVSAKQWMLIGEDITPRSQHMKVVEDIYRTIAITLEREDINRSPPNEKNDLIRWVLQEKRTLLIVDNLETVDDGRVRTFIQEVPEPTKVIVTTRHWLNIADQIHLLGMEENDGLILISKTAQKRSVSLTEDQAKRLFKHTGGVPLAIVWSIAQMELENADIVLARLGEPTSNIALFCFEQAVKRIQNTMTHKLLMALSLFDTAAGANRKTLGQVTGLPTLDRDDGLVKLEKLSLVSKHADRFRLLPLTHTFAAAQLNQQDAKTKENLQKGWLDWAAQLAKDAGGDYWVWNSVNDILIEGENLLLALNWAWENDDIISVLKLTKAVQFYLDRDGRWEEREEQINRILDKKLQDKLISEQDKEMWQRLAAFLCVHCLGFMQNKKGEVDKAEETIINGFNFFVDLQDSKGQAIALREVADGKRHQAQNLEKGDNQHGKLLDEAAKTLDRALEIAQENNDAFSTAAISVVQAQMAIVEEEYDEAERIIQDAEALFESEEVEQGSTPWVEMGLDIAKGDLALARKRFEDAEAIFENAVEIYEGKGGLNYVSQARLKLSLAKESIGKYGEARKIAYVARQESQRIGSKDQEAMAKKLLERLQKLLQTDTKQIR